MLRSDKELKLFTVKNSDLKKFTQEARKYGVLYCVLADRKNKDPDAEVDVIARAEDASKISRIAERFKLASEPAASIVTEAEQSKEEKTGQPEPDIGVQGKAEKDRLLDALMGAPAKTHPRFHLEFAFFASFRYTMCIGNSVGWIVRRAFTIS